MYRGTDTPRYEIIINGEPLKVRENLYLGLRRLRSRTINAPLWADAICINQSNIPEQNQQVAKTRDIHQRARQVIIWLGEEADDSGVGYGKYSLLEQTRRLEVADMSPSHFRQKLGPHMFRPRVWRATARLFKRPWWRRMWVVQEVAVSVVVCGRERCEWFSFMAARTAFELLFPTRNVAFFSSDDEVCTVRCIYMNVMFLRQPFLLCSSANLGSVGVLRLICLMTGYQATDDRDSLYLSAAGNRKYYC